MACKSSHTRSSETFAGTAGAGTVVTDGAGDTTGTTDPADVAGVTGADVVDGADTAGDAAVGADGAGRTIGG